ncbi:terminase small subunit [Helcococcus bovis]|uniref:terminase small subunit n=1 Tax=Helcococcus bovis TaxID=3153252 RepID=UPI0038B83699
MAKKITLKQQKFIDEYIISGNASDAARKAGYSKKTAGVIGEENLKKPYLREEIEKRLKEINDAKILTIEEAMQITTKIARGEPRTIIKKDVNGEEYQDIEYPSYNDMNKATEHFYKIKGQFLERQEVEHKGSVQFVDDIE